MTRLQSTSRQLAQAQPASLEALAFDSILSSAGQQASDAGNLLALSLGSSTFSLLKNITQSCLPRLASHAFALIGEVAAYRAARQALSASGQCESWRDWKSFTSTTLDFCLMKGVFQVFRAENYLLRHFISSSAMLGAEFAREEVGLSEKNNDALLQRFTSAFASSVALEMGGKFTHTASGHVFQRLQSRAEFQNSFSRTQNIELIKPSRISQFRLPSLEKISLFGSLILYSLESRAEGLESIGRVVHSAGKLALYGMGGLTALVAGFGAMVGAYHLAAKYLPRNYPGTESFPHPPELPPIHKNSFGEYEVTNIEGFTFYECGPPKGTESATVLVFDGAGAGPSAFTDLREHTTAANARLMIGVWDGFGDWTEPNSFLIGRGMRGRDVGELWDERAIAAVRKITQTRKIFLGGFSMGGASALGMLEAAPDIAAQILGLIPLGAPGFTNGFFGRAHSHQANFIYYGVLPLVSFFNGSLLTRRNETSINHLKPGQINYAMWPKSYSTLMAMSLICYRNLLRFERLIARSSSLPTAFLIDAGESDKTVTAESAEIVLGGYRHVYPQLRLEIGSVGGLRKETYYNGNEVKLTIVRTHHGHRVFALPEELRRQVFNLIRERIQEISGTTPQT